MAGHTISRRKLEPEQLTSEVEALGSRWSVAEGELRLDILATMTRTGPIAAFAGALADELDHHPKIVMEYGTLVLTVHTHDVGGISVADLVYAARLEQWLRANGWP